VLECPGGEPPAVDLAAERRLVDLLVEGAREGLFRSAHDCSDGGLGVALAEIAMGGPYQQTGFGLDLDLTGYASGLDAADLLFSESHGRALVTCPPEKTGSVEQLARRSGVPVYDAGAVKTPNETFALRLRDAAIQQTVSALRDVYFSAIPKRMGD
jgi:phosphoribosylformylglycinamidine (FGAM) synthase-like enzyme